MKTVLETGPGFYAADSSDHDKSLPNETLRVYCARLQIFDLPYAKGDHDDITFQLLVAQSEEDPRIAKALLKLGRVINDNKGFLEECAEA